MVKDYFIYPSVRDIPAENRSIEISQPFLKLILILSALLVLHFPHTSHAVTIYAKVSAHVIPALTAKVVGGLNFGDLSPGQTPGGIMISANSSRRRSSGGVQLRNSDEGTPATIQVMGAKNQAYSIGLPNSIHLTDEHSHDMVVDGFETSANAGHLDGRGLQYIRIGGRLNVSAGQGVGRYSGTLPVDLDYN